MDTNFVIKHMISKEVFTTILTNRNSNIFSVRIFRVTKKRLKPIAALLHPTIHPYIVISKYV